jgi:hypothetical protein
MYYNNTPKFWYFAGIAEITNKNLFGSRKDRVYEKLHKASEQHKDFQKISKHGKTLPDSSSHPMTG